MLSNSRWAEARDWSEATVAGVFYGLKAVLDGHAGDGPVLLSQIRQRVRPRRHSSATRIAEVLAELGLLHDDTTAATRWPMPTPPAAFSAARPNGHCYPVPGMSLLKPGG